jgi:hypothetical protein
MQRFAPILGAAFGALTLLAGVQTYETATAAPPPHAAESPGAVAAPPRSTARRERAATRDRIATGEHMRSPTVEVAGTARRMDATQVRRALTEAASGTYIDELLLDRDSALTRWPERLERPLTVFIGGTVDRPNWREEFRAQVRAAFESWQNAGIPIQFAFTADSARADVHVTWVDRFAEPISGKTIWSRDDRWWIVDADIVLALHHRDGAALDAAQMRAIALHEVGHLIGLDHTTDGTNIMAPRVRVRDLSAADQATARLLYSVPPGRVR